MESCYKENIIFIFYPNFSLLSCDFVLLWLWMKKKNTDTFLKHHSSAFPLGGQSLGCCDIFVFGRFDSGTFSKNRACQISVAIIFRPFGNATIAVTCVFFTSWATLFQWTCITYNLAIASFPPHGRVRCFA